MIATRYRAHPIPSAASRLSARCGGCRMFHLTPTCRLHPRRRSFLLVHRLRTMWRSK